MIWWISEKALLTDSSEILEKFSEIGPKFERFFEDQSFEDQSFEYQSLEIYFPEIPENTFGHLTINSWKFLRNYSTEIPQKFSGLGHQFYGISGELNKLNDKGKKVIKFEQLTSSLETLTFRDKIIERVGSG